MVIFTILILLIHEHRKSTDTFNFFFRYLKIFYFTSLLLFYLNLFPNIYFFIWCQGIWYCFPYFLLQYVCCLYVGRLLIFVPTLFLILISWNSYGPGMLNITESLSLLFLFLEYFPLGVCWILFFFPVFVYILLYVVVWMLLSRCLFTAIEKYP